MRTNPKVTVRIRNVYASNRIRSRVWVGTSVFGTGWLPLRDASVEAVLPRAGHFYTIFQGLRASPYMDR